MNIHALIENLEKLPDQIYQQELKTLEAKQALEDSKLTYEIKLSFETVAAKGTNATEKKSRAILAAEPERRNLLKDNIEYERQNAYLTKLTNDFIACRKMSSLEERLMQSQIN